MVGRGPEVVQVVTGVDHNIVTRVFDGVEAWLLVGGITTEQHGFFRHAGKAQFLHISHRGGVFRLFAVGNVEHGALMAVDVTGKLHGTRNRTGLLCLRPFGPGGCGERLALLRLPAGIRAVVQHGFVQIYHHGFLFARRGLGLIKSQLGAVERLVRQRLIFSGLLEPVQCQHGLICQALLGLQIGFWWLRAAGQSQ
ncbi:hypothetical protein D3C78_1171090 [compost metagenome]